MHRQCKFWLGPLVAALVLVGTAAQAQIASVGVARNAIGVLLVTRSTGQSERLQGKGAMPLFEGDELKTGPGAQALIEFHDGTRLALNEQTTLVIRSRQHRDTGITRILKVLLGEIWIKTSGGPRPLEVETPVANAAIRSTEFNLKVFPDGRSVLTVVDGVVEFGTAFGTCPIPAGATSVGERGKRCTRPAQVNVKPATAWVEEVLQ
jgi:ferric-dicitrate binding protein FerR (iron transport regulator)